MKAKALVLIITLIGITMLIFSLNSNEQRETIDYSTGKVHKTIYNKDKQVKLTIIVGMHPRETGSIKSTKNIIKNYTKYKITLYEVELNDKKSFDFETTRARGELLVNREIIPLINSNNTDLVIIPHNHQKGYGADGTWITTNYNDTMSNNIAKQLCYALNWTHYGYNGNNNPQSTSILGVDKPITNNGVPCIVLELDESYSQEQQEQDILNLLNKLKL